MIILKKIVFLHLISEEIKKCYTFVLRMEMSETSINCKASRYDGSRVCVDVILPLLYKVIPTTSIRRSGIKYHASFL